ncbi:hypothetical protein HRR83_009418 [Exophiala dermatitidis]|uniref:Zn(2)-C6 fungal-type domain-containing protein n=2 Tax=Exophiala dermatitidis TaxID=5970 RepID=H6BLQ6_EXODN|nr:uncharacterized protein HMPREF1120_01100 [Exophiala dermatitidis NIH/UT8656]KAJ4502865.1 hypothetical protein HRR73_009293 [Exophiala dermatitidis]EHY52895.1 hypothetical protein HMPREF1120_01100 [Exophiala dermatitidis NIH/UT8656]KAJ4512293.1 hypothetical protein HRR75_005194 [Exophiala dermatitidis]KAJ4515200.1 hypothetical protein HRR74_005666 [Exophiala dermatitidis]KAJ4536248.1 hypothetical protein HRR78_008597 [Exophiala dermatitidis]
MSLPSVTAQSSPTSDVNAPRKRRKRASAQGAADDCFTCATRNLECDRGRPYCSRCLADGRDCSGYKTQLTWGNGVASRGKLRGLSLPIAGAQKLATPNMTAKPKRKLSQQPRTTQSPPGKQHQTPSGQQNSCSPPIVQHGRSAAFANPPFGSANGQFPSVVPFSTTSWTQPIAPISSNPVATVAEPTHQSYTQGPSNPPLSSPLGGFNRRPGRDPGRPYRETERLPLTAHPYPSPQSAYLGCVLGPGPEDTSSAVYPSFPSPYGDVLSGEPQHVVRPKGNAPLTQSLPHQTLTAEFEEDVEEVRRDHADAGLAETEDGSTFGLGIAPFNYSLTQSPLLRMGAIGATPRMQYLIRYYVEVISPVIVAFDGPSNPYKTQILRLASRSETLQHAISALSASNLRQRRETGALSTGKTDPTRRSSMAHLTMTNGLLDDMSAEEQAREESIHKAIAIQSLNKQLADPLQRKDDAILATLLILCLFHICDSGIAKFQTQFAGVKKLLGLRRNDPGLNTKETKWFTRMFTWFDAMTATVNDREGQLRGHHVDVSASPDEEWALENLAGCDGQLFKTIARLGRLNVLSQGKPVKETVALVTRPLPPMPAELNMDYSNFDGNGFMQLLEDEELYRIRSADQDVKAQFWREWREIRQVLQLWEFDSTALGSSRPDAPSLTGDQRIDLYNISESFRYAALLYTERLAKPTVSSTEPAIRSLVQKCLGYIKAVKSDVYLLWPLFITGSECVDGEDRGVIRQRCLDIQKDSGFLNNKSCLELLEKVWQRSDKKQRRFKDRAALNIENNVAEDAGLRFRTVMKLEGNRGEYIVV